MTQAQLADAVGLTQQGVGKWLTGASTPKGQNVLRLSRALNVPVKTVAAELEEKAPEGDQANVDALRAAEEGLHEATASVARALRLVTQARKAQARAPGRQAHAAGRG